jgi:hypothetical protein
MKNYSRLASIGVLICSVLLGGDVLLYLNNLKYLLADALVFLALLICLGYLLKQASASDRSVDSSISGEHEISGGREFLQTSSNFHVQLGNEIAGQLSSAHTELGNTQAILSDAIGKLVGNFIEISDGVRNLSEHTNEFSKQIRDLTDRVNASLLESERSFAEGDRVAAVDSNKHVRAMMEDLTAFTDTVAKNAIDLNFISTRVEQNVLMVISTLQFQDMSSQLIEHARLRMTALQEVANEMGKGMVGSPTHKEYLEKIAAYNRLLDKHVTSLDRQKANPVAQKDFGTGDIELF